MERRARVLVVEDETAIRKGICDLLAYHGHEPVPVGTGTEGRDRAVEGGYDLLMLDVMLPEVDGFSICRAAREAHPGQAILMLTAKGREEDVLTGFEAGCDDYVTKPFSVAQLMARVNALLRRATTAQSRVFRAVGVEVDADNLSARREDEQVALSQRDVEVLAYLVDNEHRVVPRTDLLRDVWGYARVEHVETRCVDMHIVKLRRKLAEVTDDPVIETVRGAGYRLAG